MRCISYGVMLCGLLEVKGEDDREKWDAGEDGERSAGAVVVGDDSKDGLKEPTGAHGESEGHSGGGATTARE